MIDRDHVDLDSVFKQMVMNSLLIQIAVHGYLRGTEFIHILGILTAS